MNTAIHQKVRIIDEPGKPTTYRALCKYESQDDEEFRKDRQPTDVITCEVCLEKLGINRCDGGMKP
jgi:hypothetical protein